MGGWQMKLEVGAAAAIVLEDLNATLIALAEDEDGLGWSVAIQQAHEFTSQDVALGQNMYSVTMDAGPTCYGGIAEWSHERNAITIVLSPDAATRLETTTELIFEFPEGQVVSFREVVDGLNGILGPPVSR
jgi:hypothetical protein